MLAKKGRIQRDRERERETKGLKGGNETDVQK